MAKLIVEVCAMARLVFCASSLAAGQTPATQPCLALLAFESATMPVMPPAMVPAAAAPNPTQLIVGMPDDESLGGG